MRSTAQLRVLFALALWCGLFFSAQAHALAPSVECVEQHERAQTLQQQDQLLEARDAALACAQVSCPALLRADCSKLYGELEQGLASLVLAVRDERGRDLVHVRVEANGKLLTERVDGHALSLDPGVYKLRVSAAGYEDSELDLTLRKTEKDRLVSVELAPSRVPSADTARPTSAPSATPNEHGGARKRSSYALGAAGVVALGLGVGFGVAGKHAYRDREDSCKPGCSDHQVASIRRDYVIADVAFAVGGAALVSAVTLYWLHHRQVDQRTSRLGVELSPLRAGAFTTLRASF